MFPDLAMRPGLAMCPAPARQAMYRTHRHALVTPGPIAATAILVRIAAHAHRARPAPKVYPAE